MSDGDVATKAPESDAAEQSVLPGDTPAQHGASMGVSALLKASVRGWSANHVLQEHCVTDRPTRTFG